MKIKELIIRMTNMKSTVVAVVTGLLTVLAAVGIVSSDALTNGIAATGQLYEAILVVFGSISTVALLFTKDPQ